MLTNHNSNGDSLYCVYIYPSMYSKHRPEGTGNMSYDAIKNEPLN